MPIRKYYVYIEKKDKKSKFKAFKVLFQAIKYMQQLEGELETADQTVRLKPKTLKGG